MWPTTCACRNTRWGIFENSKQFMKYQKNIQKDKSKYLFSKLTKIYTTLVDPRGAINATD